VVVAVEVAVDSVEDSEVDMAVVEAFHAQQLATSAVDQIIMHETARHKP